MNLWNAAVGLVFAVGLSGYGAGQDYRGLEREFVSSFNTHYQARQCGLNIRGLLERASKLGFEMKKLSLVTITNEGFTVFGMVNAEVARDFVRDRPVASERNWYHHVIAVDDRGRVFDFDFDIKPTVPEIGDYVEKMFLDEAECDKPRYGEFCAGRDKKLKEYRLKWYAADELLRDADVEPYWTSSLAEALDHYTE